MALHEKPDMFRQGRWEQLVALQEWQLALLTQFAERLLVR